MIATQSTAISDRPTEPGPPTPHLSPSHSIAEVRTARFRLLVEFGRDLVRIHELSTLLSTALARAMAFSEHDGGSILLLRNPNGPLEVCASSGFDAVEVGTQVDDLTRSVAGRVLQDRQPLLLEGRGEAVGVDWRTYTKPIASVICLPLIVGDGKAIGVLALKSITAIRRLDADDIDTLMLMAAQLAAMIENAQLHEEHDQLVHQLACREQELEQLLVRLLTAHEEERRRIAYDLHDGLAQIAAGAHQHLQAYASRSRPRLPETRRALERSLELARRTVIESRRVIAGLRPTALDDFGLATAIRLEVDDLWEAGWEITFHDGGVGRLSPALESALFRVAQEALTNIRKHAPRARACIALSRDKGALRLDVRDWGCGFDLHALPTGPRQNQRLGLLSMRDRVTLLGGRIDIQSRPGEGTQILIEVPVPEG
jgi:signal transduction histidine kinase